LLEVVLRDTSGIPGERDGDQFVDQRSREAASADPQPDSPHFTTFATVIYIVAFVTGAIVMSFEMLGSRYLNPYFGSGIYTWASLISTVLAALTVGYFIGGTLADRTASAPVLATTVLIGSIYILLLPSFAAFLLELVLAGIDDVKVGSLVSALALMFFPVTFLGMYSPFAIRLLLYSAQRSGRVSGSVYGISTAGSIFGTLGTTFVLIPSIGSRAITFTLGIAGLVAGLALIAAPLIGRRRSVSTAAAAMIAAALLAAPGDASRAEDLLDNQLRAAVLAKKDGQLAHIETEYNDVFVGKHGGELTMSFQLKGWDYTESATNLKDPDDLPVRYTQVMSVGLAYPQELKTVLMLGLGGGTIPTYLGRFMPEPKIDTVELDPGVINAAKAYFGIRESERVRYLEGDGRVYLTRNKAGYDLILVDAYQGGYVPFHLLTREFYALLKERLAPGGAVTFNVHDGTKLFISTVHTLRAVFDTVDLYPSGEGEMIVVAMAQKRPEQEALARRAAELQDRYKFRFALPKLLALRTEKIDATKAELLTDDFAPVNLYDEIGRSQRRKK
jgi:spermidine synthase